MSKLSALFGKAKTPAPLPDLPTREDPEIEAARKKALVDAKTRRGRISSKLTSGSGLADDEDVIRRPGARAAKLLGS